MSDEPIRQQVALRRIIDDVYDVLDRLERLVIPEAARSVPDDTGVDKLGLSSSTVNRLLCENVRTVADLEALTLPELLDMRHIGVLKARVIEEALAAVGRTLTEWTPGR